MNKEQNKLSSLVVGNFCVVSELLATGGVRRRLFDLGICEGTRVECIGKSPFGDPTLYLVKGKMIAIRGSEARLVVITEGE